MYYNHLNYLFKGYTMKKSKFLYLWVIVFAVFILVGCGSNDDTTPQDTTTPLPQDTTDTQDTTDNTSDDINITYKVNHEEDGDYSWDSSSVVSILLNDDDISINGSGATADGSVLTITSAGVYSVSGTLTDGQIIINSEDEEIVQIILNGIDISSSTTAPIYIISAKKTVFILAENSQNYLSDATTYIYADAEEDEPDSTIFSKDDLSIAGAGSLTIDSNYNDAIKSKDGLVIAGGNIVINSVDDGIVGKDYIALYDGVLNITADGDGIKSTNDSDSEVGYVSIADGTVNITCENDAIQAETNIKISGGTFTLESGGGSSTSIGNDVSAKGLKASTSITIDAGNFTINSADDTLHSNNTIIINDGTFNLSSGDDGIHADTTLTINNGTIDITESYEGIESSLITINDGNINIVSSDDGVNVAGGTDGSGLGGRPSGQGNLSDTGDEYLYINGGTIVVDADGDGIDVNGAIEMNGGIVVVNGPTSSRDGALDYDNTFKINGGVLVAVGSSGMAQAPSSSSTQNAMLISFSGTLSANTMVHIETSSGNELLSFVPTKSYQSLVFSSSEISTGSSYDVYYGGSSTGTVSNGLYEDGSYTTGTKYTNFTQNSVITTIR